MNIETLKDRIAKAQAKIEKKENTISKKEASIAKKKATLVKKYGINADAEEINKREIDEEARWMMEDIEDLQDDIKRNRKEIEETKQTISKYELQLAGEMEKESLFITKIPECVKQLQQELIEKWDAWDFERRSALKKEYKEIGYDAFRQKRRYTYYADLQFMHKTDEEIQKANRHDAKVLVLDLYNRVYEYTGEITSWENVHLTSGAQGMSVLNGEVIGKEGIAVIESIVAGGYNIQRLHVRVLVKKY